MAKVLGCGSRGTKALPVTSAPGLKSNGEGRLRLRNSCGMAS
jgi:hypothetical protein